MILAADASYPLLGVIWTMIVFFAWVLWIWLLIYVYMDVFRRSDIGGWAKAGWVVLTLVLPYLGVFLYLITQGRSMAERREAEAQQQRAALDDYVRSVAATAQPDNADQLMKAKNLLDSGAITPEEYDAVKRKVLA
jgi:type VI protein secretion system component VasK